MLKSNGRVELNSFTEENKVNKMKEFKDLLAKFKNESGEFDYFKITSSYVEIPPINCSDFAGTYTIRDYENLKIVSLGTTLYYIDTPEFRSLLNNMPSFNILGDTGLKVARVEACYNYLNEYGKIVHKTLLNDWERLTKPYMNYRSI